MLLYVDFSRGQWSDETKYSVTHSKLMEVLSACTYCSSECSVEVACRKGAYIKFVCTCQNSGCCHTWFWENSPMHERRPLLNLLISSAILFSGSLPAKFFCAMNILYVMCPSPVTFFTHQRDYLHGVSTSTFSLNSIKLAILITADIYLVRCHKFRCHKSIFSLYFRSSEKCTAAKSLRPSSF